ncbi:hypothetical protein CGJ02_26735, partial [Vibrio parahaemolyticus]
ERKQQREPIKAAAQQTQGENTNEVIESDSIPPNTQLTDFERILQYKPSMREIVAYECGYNGKLVRWFMGYVESYKQINSDTYSLFCRELSAVLRNSLPLAMQHKTLTDVLNRVTQITGLHFVIPDR